MQLVGGSLHIAQNPAQTPGQQGHFAAKLAIRPRFLPEHAFGLQIEHRQLLTDIVMQFPRNVRALLLLRGYQARGQPLELRLALPERGEARADTVAISIGDTGIGMSEEDIELALTAFGQVDSRMTRRYDGTGLGLPLAKAIVELHRGRLEIVSHPGRGTTVTVALPRPPTSASGEAK